jgi:DME family drug/metabolite transporter
VLWGTSGAVVQLVRGRTGLDPVSIGSYRLAIAVWEAARTRRRPDPVTLGTVAAGVTGLILITASSTGAGHARPVLGLPAAIGCGLGYAASTVLSRHLAQRVAPMAMTTVSTTAGALVLIPFAVRSGWPAEPSAARLLVYLGVVATALAYALFYSGLRSTAGSSAVVLTLLEPLTAALLAVLVLGEPLPAAVLAGGALLLGAVAMLYLDPRGTG